MREKRIRFFIIMFLVVLVVGILYIVKFPDSQDKKKTEDTQNKVLLSEAYDYEKAKGIKYDNLTFPSDIKVDPVTSIDAGQVIVPSFLKENKEHVEKFFEQALEKAGKGETYDKENIIDEDNSYPAGPSYSDGEIYMALGCTGFLSIETRRIQDLEGDLINTYYVNGEYNDDIYKLKEDSVSVLEAKKIAEEGIKEYLELAGYDIDLQVQRVMVWQTKAGEYYYEVFFQQEYQGIAIVDILNRNSEIEDEYVARMGACCYITGKSVKDIVSLTITEGALRQYQEKMVERIISLSDAAGLLNTLLSSYRKYNVKDIKLEHMLIYKGNQQIDSPDMFFGKEEMKHRKVAEWATTCSYDIYLLVPCWAFYFDTSYDAEIVAYVNCETGKVNFICNQ